MGVLPTNGKPHALWICADSLISSGCPCADQPKLHPLHGTYCVPVYPTLSMLGFGTDSLLRPQAGQVNPQNDEIGWFGPFWREDLHEGTQSI